MSNLDYKQKRRIRNTAIVVIILLLLLLLLFVFTRGNKTTEAAETLDNSISEVTDNNVTNNTIGDSNNTDNNITNNTVADTTVATIRTPNRVTTTQTNNNATADTPNNNGATTVTLIKPTVNLNGETNITVEYKGEFEDPGIQVQDGTVTTEVYFAEDSSSDVWEKVEGVNTASLGVYNIYYTIFDNEGNKVETVKRTVSVNDTVLPTADVTVSSEANTNEDVTVTIKASEALKEIAGWTKVDDTTFTRTFSKNVEETITVEDLAGNKLEVSYKISNIDKTVPTVEVATSNESKDTNQDVTVTIKASEALKEIAGWTKIDDTTFTKIFGENVEETITVEDISGNKKEVSYKVEGIDKVAPTATVTYSKTEPTNRAVIVTLTASEAITLDKTAGTWLDKGGNVYQKSYPENKVQEIKFKDLAGNEGNVTVTIENIDKVEPTATVTYSKTEPTNGAVIVTLTASEAITLDKTAGTWLDKGGNVYQKSYPQNKVQEIKFKDLAGNEGSVTVTINNIDKELPTGKVTTSNGNGKYSTNQDVTATLVASEPIKDIEGWTRVSGSTFTKVYSANTKTSVEIEDLAGNKQTVNFEVKRIDKVPAKVTVVDSNKYKMEINTPYVEKGYSAYDEVDKDLTNRVKITYQFQAKGTGTWPFVDELDTSKLGTYKVIYTVSDKAGNVSKGSRVVEIVDTTDPVITLNGESNIDVQINTSYTDEGVTVTDNSNENITATMTVYYSKDGKDGTWTNAKDNKVDVSVLGYYNIWYSAKDSSGNESSVRRTVRVMDNINPIIALNGDSVVTIEVHNDFVDPGVTITDNSKESIAATLTVYYSKTGLDGTWAGATDNKIDTSVLGQYNVWYTATDSSGNYASVRRTVIVKDESAPVIELYGKDTFEVGVDVYTYPEAGKVTDNYDGNISFGSVNIKWYKATPEGEKGEEVEPFAWETTLRNRDLGDYYIEYWVSDSSGNTGYAHRIVTLQDTINPGYNQLGIMNINQITEGYAKVGDRVWVYAVINEHLAQEPEIKINGVKAKIVQTEDGAKFGADWYKYVGEVVMTEEMAEGEIQFTVSGYKDFAGNEGDPLTNADINKGVSAIKLDKTKPGYNQLGIMNINQVTEGYAKVGDRVWVYAVINEHLSQEPEIKINDVKAKIVQTEDGAKFGADWYKYVGEVVMTEEMAEGEITFTVSGYKDFAGNEGDTLTNADINKGVSAIKLDKTAPALTVDAISEDPYVRASDATKLIFNVIKEGKLIDVITEDRGVGNSFKIGWHGAGEYVIEAIDEAGNKTTVTSIVGKKVTSASELTTAVANAEDGDLIYIANGNYDVKHLSVTKNITLKGESKNAKIIVSEDKLNGQAGVYLKANATLENVTVEMTNNAYSAIKASKEVAPLTKLSSVTIKNVDVIGGYAGINIHGVENAIIDNVTVKSAAKLSVSTASSNVKITNSNLAAAAWGAVGIMYNPSNPSSYPTAGTVNIGSGNTISGTVYTEHFAEGNDFTFANASAWNKADYGTTRLYTQN